MSDINYLTGIIRALIIIIIGIFNKRRHPYRILGLDFVIEPIVGKWTVPGSRKHQSLLVRNVGGNKRIISQWNNGSDLRVIDRWTESDPFVIVSVSEMRSGEISLLPSSATATLTAPFVGHITNNYGTLFIHWFNVSPRGKRCSVRWRWRGRRLNDRTGFIISCSASSWLFETFLALSRSCMPSKFRTCVTQMIRTATLIAFPTFTNLEGTVVRTECKIAHWKSSH
jgi:hypothetical protein